MPDSFEHMPPAIRSERRAGVARGERRPAPSCRIADLILVQPVRSTVERLVAELRRTSPIVMTFSATAQHIAQPVRRSGHRHGGRRRAHLTQAQSVRGLRRHRLHRPGEGERRCARAARDRKRIRSPRASPGCRSELQTDGFALARPVIPLASEDLRLPNREARVLSGYTLLGRPVDVVETSRGVR